MTTQEQLQTPHCLMFKYRYERLLGEGTNGKTYLATDLRTGQKLAIKELKISQSDNFKSFELFKREAETLSSLNVNGVPKFYESLLSEELGGECYIVQEYIHAPSIQSYLNNKRKFTEEETLLVMQKTAQILNVLHSQYSPPVIHRDIKPSNILCDLPNGAPWDNIHPYLIDFGAVANAHSNTDKSTIAGTIGYMAPEQNFGECLPQTDLYALGATALHMLTGVPPYEMDFDTYSLKFEDAINEHAPKTSKEMRALLSSLLQVSYDKRPESASALLHEIAIIRGEEVKKEIQEDEPKLSPIARVLYKLFFWKKSNRLKPVELTYDFLSKLQSPIENAKILKTALATVHSNIYNNYYKVLEYTFNAEGSTWAGAHNFQEDVNVTYPEKVAISQSPRTCIDPTIPPPPEQVDAILQALTLPTHTLQNLQFPLRGMVLYHADDPSCNRLLYIILNPQKEKTDKDTQRNKDNKNALVSYDD